MESAKFFAIVIFFCLTASSCTTVKIGEHIPYVGEAPKQETVAENKSIEARFSGKNLKKIKFDTVYAAKEIGLMEQEKSERSAAIKMFPDWLAEDDTFKNIVEQDLYQLSKSETSRSKSMLKGSWKPKEQQFEAKKLSEFSLRLIKNSGLIYKNNTNSILSLIKKSKTKFI